MRLHAMITHSVFFCTEHEVSEKKRATLERGERGGGAGPPRRPCAGGGRDGLREDAHGPHQGPAGQRPHRKIFSLHTCLFFFLLFSFARTCLKGTPKRLTKIARPKMEFGQAIFLEFLCKKNLARLWDFLPFLGNSMKHSTKNDRFL